MLQHVGGGDGRRFCKGSKLSFWGMGICRRGVKRVENGDHWWLDVR